MGAWQIAETIGYALLAAFATKISWRTPSGVVGLTLVVCCVITTGSFFTRDFGTRVFFEVIQATLLTFAARLAFRAAPSWSTLLIVLLCVVDFAWCAVQPAFPPHGHSRGFWFGTVTNIIFTLACLLAAYPGIRDVHLARRNARRGDGLVGGRAVAGHAGRDPSR